MIALFLNAESQKRSYRLNTVLAVLGMVCSVVIEALHGHECVGDGCLCCLVAACARMLLFLCVGVGVARPVIRVLVHARTARILLISWRRSRPLEKCSSELLLPAATPFSMGVMLRI